VALTCASAPAATECPRYHVTVVLNSLGVGPIEIGHVNAGNGLVLPSAAP
jgi:hypothetical protein